MSFQSFSKLTPAKHQPKNLPTPEFINILNTLCQGTNNYYDPRTHSLIIHNLIIFQKQLEQKCGRTLQSFERQLKILGFKKQKEITIENNNQQNEETQRLIVKYFWRGKKEQYICKELDFLEKHLGQIIVKANNYRQSLSHHKEVINDILEKSIFCSLSGKEGRLRSRISRAVDQSKKGINWAHELAGEMVRDMQINLDNQISLLRLLAFRPNQHNQQ